MSLGTLAITVVACMAALALAAFGMLWRGVDRVQRASSGRMGNVEGKLNKLEARLKRQEAELARQAVELEELGIQLETRAYWEE